MLLSFASSHPSRRRHQAALLLCFGALLLVRPLRAQQPTSVAADGPFLDPYRAARTPVLSVVLAKGAATGVNARLAKLAALASGNPAPGPAAPLSVQSADGVFGDVSLGYLDGTGKPPAPATVSLQFNAAQAAAPVWVQPMDGGAILGQDKDGNPVSLPGGTFVALDATGAGTFSFQAPARTGRFQVLIRCQNVASTLPFVVLDPAADN